MNSIIAVTFNAETAEAATNFFEFLKTQIESDSTFHSIDNMEGLIKGKGKHLYVSLSAHFIVPSENLADTLDQIHYFLYNVPEDFKHLYDNLLTGSNVSVLVEEASVQVSELLHSLQKRVQALEYAAKVAVRNNFNMNAQIEKQTKQIDALEEQYKGLQAFLTNGIDIKTLRDVVIDTAMKVDKDIILDHLYNKVTIQ